MQEFSPADMFEDIAKAGIEKQKRQPGDFVNDAGLLVCGTCLAPRQIAIDVADPLPENPDHVRTVIAAVTCECEKAEERKEKTVQEAKEGMEKILRLRSASLMDAMFTAFTFDNFRQTKYNGKNLKLCRRYAQKFDEMLEKNQGLLFWGDVGTGKSFAAACIANYLLEHKTSVMMTSFVKLLKTVHFGDDGWNDIIRRLNRVKLVVFDDLGAERDTGYAIERVYDIVDSRCRAKLPMILTTNLTLDEMMSEPDMRYKRIFDRVLETCYPMQFTGPSFRGEEAFRRFDEMEKLLAED